MLLKIIKFFSYYTEYEATYVSKILKITSKTVRYAYTSDQDSILWNINRLKSLSSVDLRFKKKN